MGVRRVELPFEGHFTQIPNAWLRDQRLSRRARGLLSEIMSHRVGWHVTISSLQKAGAEGRDAIRTALTELREAGYLQLVQTRGEQGRWNEVEYELCVPATGDGFSDSGGFTGSGSADVGSADVGQSDTKNTISSEDHLKEHENPLPPAGGSRDVVKVTGIEELQFEVFYKIYPRHTGRLAAERAYRAALKKAPADEILAGARRFAADPNLPPKEEQRFIPMPATWLNQGRWDDDPLPPRSGGRAQEKQQSAIALVRGYQEREEQEHEEVGAGVRPRLGLVR